MQLLKLDNTDQKWNSRFLAEAKIKASYSKDPNTKVGAVIYSAGSDRTMLNSGYNGFPRGVNDDIDTRWERPLKYQLVAHAEANALMNCARKGIAVEGAMLYVTHIPCNECAKLIIQAGIKTVICDIASIQNEDFFKRWKDSADITLMMFDEANVEVFALDLNNSEFYQINK